MAKPTLTRKQTKTLVANLIRWRERKDLSPADASSRLRKARTYVIGLEAGNFTPSLKGLSDLAKLYGTKVAVLLKGV